VIDANPHLESVRDHAGVLRYCTILARIEQVYTWLDEQPHAVFEDARRGKTHPVYERLEKWDAAADRAEARLAISARARFELFAELPQYGPPPVDPAVVTDPAVRAAARTLVDAAARVRAASAAPAGSGRLDQPERGCQQGDREAMSRRA
jgi:cell pole-organizing protein PopZ